MFALVGITQYMYTNFDKSNVQDAPKESSHVKPVTQI